MDDLLKTAINQAPGLVVLAVVVSAFLKYIARRDGNRDEFMKDMHASNLEERESTRRIVEENSKCLRDVTIALTELRASFRYYDSKSKP